MAASRRSLARRERETWKKRGRDEGERSARGERDRRRGKKWDAHLKREKERRNPGKKGLVSSWMHRVEFALNREDASTRLSPLLSPHPAMARLALMSTWPSRRHARTSRARPRRRL